VPGVPINSVKFNDNGQRLAYSTEAGVIQVYELNFTTNDDKLSPKLLHTFCVSKPNQIVSICWDSMNDNRLFIAISNAKKKDDHIQIWNIGEKKCEHIISFGDVRIECMECSHNAKNRLIVSGTNETGESMLYLYDECANAKAEWKLISKSQQMENIIACIEFNHNGKIIMCGFGDGNIRIFDVKNGYFTELMSWNGHCGAIQSIHLCDDANSILSIAKDFVVKHWQINNDKNLLKREWKLQTNDDLIVPLLCLGPNNFFAVTQPNAIKNDGKEDNVEKKSEFLYNVMIKNISDANEELDILIGGHSKIITAIDWHKESQMIATSSSDGTLRIFQIFSS